MNCFLVGKYGTGFTPNGAYKAINRLVSMGILKPMIPGDAVYGQKWVYSDYVELFERK